MNNVERLILSKSAMTNFNNKQRSFISGFKQPGFSSSDSRYSQSLAEDNAQSERIADQHRQQSMALRNKPQQRQQSIQGVSPTSSIAAMAGGMSGSNQFNFRDTTNYSPRNQPTEAQQQLLQRNDQQKSQLGQQNYNQAWQSLYGNRQSPSSKSNRGSNTLAFNVNRPGQFSPTR